MSQFVFNLSIVLYSIAGAILLFTLLGYVALRFRKWTWRDTTTSLALVFAALSTALYALPDSIKVKHCVVVYETGGILYYMADAFVLFSFAIRLWVLSKNESLEHRIPLAVFYILLVGSFVMLFFLPIGFAKTFSVSVGLIKTKQDPTCIRKIPKWFIISHLAVGALLHFLNTMGYFFLLYAKKKHVIKQISSPQEFVSTKAITPEFLPPFSPTSSQLSPLFRRTMLYTALILLCSLILFAVVWTLELSDIVMLSLCALQSVVNASSLALPFIIATLISRRECSFMFYGSRRKEVERYIGDGAPASSSHYRNQASMDL